MSLVLTVVGFSVVCFGILGFVNPRRMRELSNAGETRSRFRSAVMMRILVGMLLIGAAPSSRFPDTVSTFGVIALLVAIGMYRLGLVRFESATSWWSDRPALVQRAASMVAVGFGLFLFYAPA
jgi:hypothetical protein